MVGLLKGIHAVNLADAVTLRRMLRGVNVFFIPNGVNCERFKPIARKRGDVFQIIFVGALSEDKGVDIVLKVAEELKAKYPAMNAKVVIVSTGGPLEQEVLRAFAKGIVDYRGFLEDNLLADLYAQSHVALFPSRDDTFPLVLLEAQACGTPVICSNLIAYKQAVKDRTTGIICKEYSVSAFYRCLNAGL